MRNIWICLLFQIKLILKNWRALLLFMAVPMLFLVVAYWLIINLFHPEERLSPIKIAIVDMDKTMETAFVIQQLENNEQLQKSVEIYETNEASAEELMKDDAIAAIVFIPEGFSKDVRRGVNSPVTVITSEKRPLQSQLIRNLMDSAAKLTSAAQSGINTVWNILDEEGFSKKVRETEFHKSVLSFTLHIIGRDSVFEEHEYSHLFQTNINQYYILSFYVLLLFIWSFGAIFLLKHEDSRAFQLQLQLRGVTSFQQMAATQMVLLLLLLTPSVFMCWVLQDFFFSIQDNRFGMIIAGISITAAFSTLFLLLHTVVRQLKVYQIVGIIFMIVGAILGGHLVPTVFFPVWIENISAFSINGLALQYILSIGSEEERSALLFLVISGVQFLLTIVCSAFSHRGEI